MTTVTFENAALSQIVKRLERIAPKSGEAFDKAAGFLMEIDPEADWKVCVKVTNLDVYYMEWINCISAEGEKTVWRIPSAIFTSIISKLPIGSGKSVRLAMEGRRLSIESGRLKAAMGTLDPQYYPEWGPFDPSSIAPVAELGSRIEQVAWATEKSAMGDAKSGIRFNGETLAATDGHRLASVPCLAPHLGEQIVVPLSVVAPILKEMGGETKIGVLETQLALMPNDYTQIRCSIYGGKYPPIERVMKRDHPNSITFDKGQLIDAINRVTTIAMRERMQLMQMYIGQEEIVVAVVDDKADDKIMDAMPIEGQATHHRHLIYFTPSYVTDVLGAAPGERVTLHYDVSNNTGLIRIEGGSDYEGWIVPRRVNL